MKQPIWILGAALVLAGCGQKGPLYLPERNEAVITTPVQPTDVRREPLPGEGRSASSSSSSSSAQSSSSSSSR